MKHPIVATTEPASMEDAFRRIVREEIRTALEAWQRPEPPLAMSLTAVGDVLGIDPRTVKKMVDMDLLPTLETGTNRILIPRRAVEEFVNAQVNTD